MHVSLELITLERDWPLHSMQQSLASKTYRSMDHAAIYDAITRHSTYIIRCEDNTCGFLILKDQGDHILLDELGVIAEFQGRGIGAATLEMMFDFPLVRGRRIELFTHPENPAVRLYARNGFREIERIENYYGDGEPRIRMVREAASSSSITLGDEERTAAKIKMMRFNAMNWEERLTHFKRFSADMCSDEWRKKFKEYIVAVASSPHAATDPLFLEISAHCHIEQSLFRKTDDIPGCRQCRDAFSKIVEETALDW